MYQVTWDECHQKDRIVFKSPKAQEDRPMNPIIYKLTALTRLLCILMVVTLGIASVTGSGDDNGDSTTEYETIFLPIEFEQIDAMYDADNPTPITLGCTEPTTMLAELLDAGTANTESIRVIDSTITSMQVNYRSVWTDVQSIQDIVCNATVEGEWDGPIDQAVLKFGDWIGWRSANAINNNTQVAFTNYSVNYEKEFQICVSCQTNNLFNSYTLEYLVKMDIELTVAYDDVEDVTTE